MAATSAGEDGQAGGGAEPPAAREPHGLRELLKHVFLGDPRDPRDPNVFHKISLMAFLAWVGLGADGLSSSSYGPDEAYRTLAGHEYLAFYLALLMALTVGVISFCYSLVVERFPSGGGGYVVASKLLGPLPGVISGSALVVDYVLTITVSVASGVEALLSFMPYSMQSSKVPLDFAILAALLVLNLRGVKESIKVLLPIFLVFLATHAVLLGWGILSHLGTIRTVAGEVHRGLASDVSTLGTWAVLLIFLRAYSLGGGTYTGIEAVSNGVQILREPRVPTAKRTMLYMAVSLALTAGGILLAYLLWGVVAEPGKTMNAVLLDRVFGGWSLGGLEIGPFLVVLTLLSEGALLFVAAQTGFIDGPRVLSNMALDSWVPHRFANLSERLVTQNGVVLMAIASGLLLVYTKGSVSFLVVLYSINVFVTFTLTQFSMCRLWLGERERAPRWKRYLAIHGFGFVLCATILTVVVLEKFRQGGWLTLVITGSLIGLCLVVQKHYGGVRREIQELNRILSDLPAPATRRETAPPDPERPVAVLLVSGYGGLGIHSLLSVQRLFPGHYGDFLFVAVGRVDSGAFKGREAVDDLVVKTEADLNRYVDMAQRFGLRAGSRYRIGTDVVHDSEALCAEVAREFPRAVFFMGKLVFAQDRFSYRFLHNDTANSIQRRLQFGGLQTVILPIRIRLAAGWF